MPVDITQLNKQTTQTVQLSPKFFNDKLTGKGGKVGVLSILRNPANLSPDTTSSQEAFRSYRYKVQNNGALLEVTPMSVVSRNMWRNLMTTYYHPDTAEMTKLTNLSADGDIYIHTRMFSAMYTETPAMTKHGSVTKKWEFVYQVFLYRLNDKTSDKCVIVDALRKPTTKDEVNRNEVCTFFTANPVKRIVNIGKTLPVDWQKYITTKMLMDYACNLSAFDLCAKEVERWHNSLHTEIDWIMTNAEDDYDSGVFTANNKEEYVVNETAAPLRFLETYKVPLEEYREIYKIIAKHIKDTNIVNKLCKNNLNLLLSDTLNELNSNRANLQQINPKPGATVSGKRYSPEQINAITSTEPLAIVQAGAGTGKSTVILGRINYLVNAGVDPKDITVLSFTNAAADHIKEKNPNVHSMTIASMINSIYTMNFPSQQLSDNKTIRNTIDAYFPAGIGRDSFYDEFKKHIQCFITNDTDAYTRMNDFVENNYDKVINTLETLKQVSLELQIIICYQKIESMLEPTDVQSKYLIIDEVQDNSIFEFVYFLKYVNKHKEALFIVGDGSQTLYEFRASNPRALNIMEASGVFKAYQLNTNYRSNQEILDFANVYLDKIEANRYARIQLQSNNILNKVTHKSFTEKVKLHYEFIPKLRGMSDALDTWLSLYVKKYIDDKLKYNEPVTFLAFRRETVFQVQNWLEQNYPGYTIANLVPERPFSSDVLSKFIGKYWNDVKFMPSMNITVDICQAILRRLDYLVRDAQKALAPTQRMLNDWADGVINDVNVWYTQYTNKQITQDEFLSLIQQSMIQYEIENNNIRRSLISQKNEETKRQQAAMTANFVLSTIHSAKGLEFENVVVIYRNDNSMGEEQKRMYYVALTRAMKSEYILAFDNTNSPQIKADYDTICKTLKEKAAKARTAGTTVGADN